MSYWFYMHADLGGPEPVTVKEGINYTSNVGRMWSTAVPGWPKSIDGRTGDEAAPLLRAGIADMDARPDVYAAMNPPNGWGDAVGARRVLAELLEWAEAAPRARFYFSG